jgi:hypothetical protein
VAVLPAECCVPHAVDIQADDFMQRALASAIARAHLQQAARLEQFASADADPLAIIARQTLRSNRVRP